MELTEIFGTTKKEVMQAQINDFKNSIQYSSTLTIKGLDAVITRNINDYCCYGTFELSENE